MTAGNRHSSMTTGNRHSSMTTALNLPHPKRRHRGHFGKLAMLYYPDRGYKRAVHLFRQEIVLTRGLLGALRAIGYHENQRILTPRQVQVIENFLGEP